MESRNRCSLNTHSAALLLGLLCHAVLPCKGGVLIPSKAVKGSACLHEQQDGLPLHFDHGELAEHMLLSRGVHLTRHGVRFISQREMLWVSPQILGTAFPCTGALPAQHRRYGSLCAVLGPPAAAAAVVSYILPCSLDHVPRVGLPQQEGGGETTVSSFIQSNVPEDVRGCQNIYNSEDAGTRQTALLLSPSIYDLTQCDLLFSSITVFYSIEQETIYLRHGVELDGIFYALTGLTIVILVALVAHSIVEVRRVFDLHSAARTYTII